MKELKTTKYMDLFTTLGCIIGFIFIILYSLLKWSYIYLLVGVAVIFIGRFGGYALDRLSEKK